MKKFLQIPLLLAVALLTSIPISAHNFEVDGIYYNILSGTNKWVAVTYRGTNSSDYTNEYTGSVIIPAVVTYSGVTYSVTSIYTDAFYGCTGLTSVTIPNSVTSIGRDAFKNTGWYLNQPDGILYLDNCCLGWKGPESYRPKGNLVLNNNTRVIATAAFFSCDRLTSVNIPNSVTHIDHGAFCESGLTSVNIPNSVTYIGDRAFGASGLTSVNIPNSVTYIGNGAFSGCTNLTSVNIPNSVTYIGDGAFGASGLTSVNIPNSVTSIGEYVFEHCYNLTSVNIPNSVTSIGKSAFDNCTGLTSVTIPNSVTSIGEIAFRYCIGLTSVNIPNSVTYIGNGAFSGCTNLTSVNIPNSVTSIDANAFNNTGWYNNQPNGILYLDNCCLGWKGSMPEGKLVLNNNTRLIAASAFSGCSGLTEVTIPNSVTHICAGAFFYCTGLTSVNIPNSVTSIDANAFYNTGWYNNQPNGILYLDNCCLGWKGSMPEGKLVLNNNTRLIAAGAFSSCRGLTSVNIPNSVTRIGDRAFSSCKGLTSVTSLNPTPPECGVNSFIEDYSANLYVPAGSIEAYSRSSEWEKFENIAEFANVTVSTLEDKASFEIPTTEGAASYTVDVYADKDMTQLVASTNYDANGKIVPMSTTLELSLDGFANGRYYYAIIVKSSVGEVLNNYKGTFEIDSAGISNIATDNATEIARYDIHGRVLSEPISGLNIVVFSDGSIRKMYIK